jgi:hypothetical protein
VFCIQTLYLCHPTFVSVGDTDTFQLKADTGELSLLKELDREEVDTHTLVVYVTNFVDGAPKPPAEDSKLNITIKVIIFVCLFWVRQTPWARASSFKRFLDHIKLRKTFVRAPLEE